MPAPITRKPAAKWNHTIAPSKRGWLSSLRLPLSPSCKRCATDTRTGHDMRVIPACRAAWVVGWADSRLGRPVVFVPCLVQRHRPAGGTVISLGHRLLDDYLE